jgi:hypothetical protein
VTVLPAWLGPAPLARALMPQAAAVLAPRGGARLAELPEQLVPQRQVSARLAPQAPQAPQALDERPVVAMALLREEITAERPEARVVLLEPPAFLAPRPMVSSVQPEVSEGKSAPWAVRPALKQPPQARTARRAERQDAARTALPPEDALLARAPRVARARLAPSRQRMESPGSARIRNEPALAAE